MSDFLDHFEKYGEKIVYGDSRKDDLDDDPEGESPAYEVLKFRESNGFFGGETHIHTHRIFSNYYKLYFQFVKIEALPI